MPTGVYDHSKRIKHRTPEEKAAAHAAAVAKYQTSPKGKRAIERAGWNQNERNWRHRTTAREKQTSQARELKRAGLSLVSKGTLHNPPLYYLDRHGAIRREDTRSAEQLIRDFQRQSRRTKKGGGPP